MTLMFQLEVAERICAEPGSSAYGRLSVIAQSRARPRPAMRVPASAFTPPPKVESGVVHFETLPEAELFAGTDALETVTAACNLFRATPVGDGTYKLWKYIRVEARIGRELVIPE